MKKIQYQRYGGSEEMRLEDVDLPSPGAGQIAVRVMAASVNPVDWKIRNGMMKLLTGRRFPRAMGTDFSGIVQAVGRGVSHLKPGDAVFGLSRLLKESGAFAEIVVTDEKLAVLKPAKLSFEEAACLPVVGTTAWNGLVDKAKLSRGQSVFITGCLGNVGRAALQLAVSHGAQVSGSCSAKTMNEARQLGATTVVDYASDYLAGLAGRFDVVFDTAGTLSLQQARRLLRSGGLYLDVNPTMAKMLRGMFTPGYRLVACSPAALLHISKSAAAGILMPSIGKTVSLGEAIPAIAALEHTGQPKGKLVIAMAAGR